MTKSNFKNIVMTSLTWSHHHCLIEKRHQNNVTNFFPICPHHQNFWLRQWLLQYIYFAKYRTEYRTGTAILFEKSTEYQYRGTFILYRAHRWRLLYFCYIQICFYSANFI